MENRQKATSKFANCEDNSEIASPLLSICVSHVSDMSVGSTMLAASVRIATARQRNTCMRYPFCCDTQRHAKAQVALSNPTHAMAVRWGQMR